MRLHVCFCFKKALAAFFVKLNLVFIWVTKHEDRIPTVLVLMSSPVAEKLCRLVGEPTRSTANQPPMLRSSANETWP